MAAASTLFRLTGTGMVRVGPGAAEAEEAPEVEAAEPRDARAERAESLKALRGGHRGLQVETPRGLRSSPWRQRSITSTIRISRC